MTAAPPVPRRIKTPSWFDLRLLIGISLVLMSVVAGARVVSSADRTYRLVAVTHDLAAGAVLRGDDVHPVAVRVPAHGRGVYLDSTAAAVGKQLVRPVSRGELLPNAAVTPAPALTTVAIPFGGDEAPKIADGQRIQVWVTTKSCTSLLLLADATVQDVHQSSGGSFSSGDGQRVTLALEPLLAARVEKALAVDGASIRAGVLSGPAQDGVQLPPLDACAAPTS